MALLPFMQQNALDTYGSPPFVAPQNQNPSMAMPTMAPQNQNLVAAEPFTWGAGGARLTPEQLAAQRAIAEQLMQSDFSPVGSVWEGLGRVANNVTGALDARNIGRKEEAAAARDAEIAQMLLSGDKTAVNRALLDPTLSPTTRQFAELQFKQANKAGAPHYWETNDGSLGMVGPDGIPKVLYQDPTAKINWIQADNPDGTKQLIPVGPGGPLSGQPQGMAPQGGLPTAPVGKLTPITGGAGSNAGGGF